MVISLDISSAKVSYEQFIHNSDPFLLSELIHEAFSVRVVITRECKRREEFFKMYQILKPNARTDGHMPFMDWMRMRIILPLAAV